MTKAPCPCGSNQSYEQCCAIFHESIKKPETAEQLMRSRYSAFVKKMGKYLVETHDPSTRAPDLAHSLQGTFDEVTWLGLEVLETEEGGKKDRKGKVRFRAHYASGDSEQFMEEYSEFVKKKKRWFYVGPIGT